jgi:hypothetical protein
MSLILEHGKAPVQRKRPSPKLRANALGVSQTARSPKIEGYAGLRRSRALLMYVSRSEAFWVDCSPCRTVSGVIPPRCPELPNSRNNSFALPLALSSERNKNLEVFAGGTLLNHAARRQGHLQQHLELPVAPAFIVAEQFRPPVDWRPGQFPPDSGGPGPLR